MVEHTKEPWRVFNHSWCETSILADGFDHGICRLDINHATEESQDADYALMEANARRIVACVNACAGVPTYQLTGEQDTPTDLGGLIDTLRARVTELESALTKSAFREADLVEELNVATIYYADAIDDIESWADYASGYFREKHDLAGCLEGHRAALAKIKEAS